MLYLNATELGDYSAKSSNMTFAVVKPAGVKKTGYLRPYMNGVQAETIKVSFSTTDLGGKLAAIRTLLLNGEGVWYLRDSEGNYIYLNQAYAWVIVESVDATGTEQHRAAGRDDGEITLNCVVAPDGTGSTFTPP